MLKKMRWRVIVAAMLAFFAVVSLIATLVNVVDYYVMTERLDQTLSYILGYEERVPETPNPPKPSPGGQNPGAPNPGAQNRGGFMALPDEESNYMTRFFVVRMDGSGGIVSTSRDYIASVDEEEAESYAKKALEEDDDYGYINEYRYLSKKVNDGRIIIFLNATRELQYMRSLLLLTIVVSGASLALVFVLVLLLSGRAIKPIADNIARQKQFITDASHELKTPLTSISTSLDVIALEHGDDEWTENIRSQTGRMSKLVSELVTLSKLDEVSPLPNKEQFSLSNAAWEIAEVYQPQAKAGGKNMEISISDDITMFGEKTAIQQMLSVLLDNAIRYSDENGDIRFALYRKGSKIRIEVFNTCQFDEMPDVNRLFDRFYRPDSSRSTETGGTGVGLAIAKAVAETHGGSISASCPSGKTMTIKVNL